jgi:hypothetical protein
MSHHIKNQPETLFLREVFFMGFGHLPSPATDVASTAPVHRPIQPKPAYLRGCAKQGVPFVGKNKRLKAEIEQGTAVHLARE